MYLQTKGQLVKALFVIHSSSAPMYSFSTHVQLYYSYAQISIFSELMTKEEDIYNNKMIFLCEILPSGYKMIKND